MKPAFLWCSFFFFFFFFFAVSAASARPMLHNVNGVEKPPEISQQVSDSKLADNNSMDEIMGIETCESGDDECLKRRLLSEAHLDYIYTQHQKP